MSSRQNAGLSFRAFRTYRGARPFMSIEPATVAGARGADRAEAAARATETNFERLRAPFTLRCGALLIDYVLLVAILAVATLFARTVGGARGASASVLATGYVAVLMVAVANFVLLTVLTGRTLGKWVTGLHVERRDGRPLSFGRALLRHVLGYALTLATAGIGFLVAAFSAEGRALHDLVAGTVVVRDRPNVRPARPRQTAPR